MTQRLNITLLGHKDHGKSTLIGRLLYDTGSAKEDRIQEVREISQGLGKSFEYAFLLDSFQEEREKEMTIDVIHAQIKGGRYLYDCIDVPGHKELIKNMLTGASHADAGILIVSVKEGIEEQTSHHLRLAQWLGLERLIIAINKMDLAGYDRNVFEEMRDKISTLTGDGFSEKMSYVPVSACQGDNVVQRSSAMSWYNGRTLFESMENLTLQDPLSQKPLRLPIQDIYSGPNGERIVAGRIESGSILIGQPVYFSPSGATSKVKAILSSNKSSASASTGENVGILCDPEPSSLKRGEVCCSQDSIVIAKSEVVAHAIFLEPPPREVMAECGTAQAQCHVEYLSHAEIGEVTAAVFRFSEPMVAERSRTAIGRLALKKQGKIIGVALIV